MANAANGDFERPESIRLKEFIETQLDSIMRLMDERDRLYTTQFGSSKVAVEAALAAQEKAVNAAFLASEKAIVKAEDAQREYNIRSNEFRGQLDDQAKTLMSRNEALTMFKSIEDKLVDLRKTFDERTTTITLTFESKLEQHRLSGERSFDGVGKEIAGLRESRSQGEGRGVGADKLWGYIVGGVGLALAVVAFWVAMH